MTSIPAIHWDSFHTAHQWGPLATENLLRLVRHTKDFQPSPARSFVWITCLRVPWRLKYLRPSPWSSVVTVFFANAHVPQGFIFSLLLFLSKACPGGCVSETFQHAKANRKWHYVIPVNFSIIQLFLPLLFGDVIWIQPRVDFFFSWMPMILVSCITVCLNSLSFPHTDWVTVFVSHSHALMESCFTNGQILYCDVP